MAKFSHSHDFRTTSDVIKKDVTRNRISECSYSKIVDTKIVFVKNIMKITKKNVSLRMNL